MKRLLFAFTALLPVAAWAQPATLGVSGGAITVNGAPLLSTTGNASATTVTPTGGTTARTLATVTADMANVLAFGADPTGTNDSTAAIIAAIATGRSVWVPAGIYLVSNQLTLLPWQKMYGDGRMASVLLVPATFNLSALGVVRFTASGSDSNSQLADIGISFEQPQQSIRANIIQFPPAIYAQNAGRVVIDRVRVSGGPPVCLDARGNTGGSFIKDFECGALTTGMLWGSVSPATNAGSKDGVHISGYHFWDFGFAAGTALYTGVFTDGNTVAANFGEIDGLDMRGTETYVGSLVFNSDAANGWYLLDNTMIDTATMSIAGSKWLQSSNMYWDGGTATVPGVTVTGGDNQFSNIYNSGPNLGSLTGAPAISVTGGRLAVYGGKQIAYPATSGAAVDTVSGTGNLEIDNVELDTNTTPWTQPYIQATGSGTLKANNNQFDVYASGPGIAIATDAAINSVQGNNFGSWTFAAPGTLGSYQIQGNSAATFTVNNAGASGANICLNGNSAAPEHCIRSYNGDFQMMNNAYTVTLFDENDWGGIRLGGSTPSVGTCGTSPSVTGTDSAATITVGSGTVTSCNMAFAYTHAYAPNTCVVSANLSGTPVAADVTAMSTTGVTIATASNVAGGKIHLLCF